MFSTSWNSRARVFVVLLHFWLQCSLNLCFSRGNWQIVQRLARRGEGEMKCLCTRHISCSLSARGRAQIKYLHGTASLHISRPGFVPSRQIQSMTFLLTESNFRPICSGSRRPFLSLCKSARVTLSFALFPFLSLPTVGFWLMFCLHFRVFSNLFSRLLLCAPPSHTLLNTYSGQHRFLLFFSFLQED